MVVVARFGPDPADYPRGELAQVFADGYAAYLAAAPPGVVHEPGFAVRWRALTIPATSEPVVLVDNPDEPLWSVRLRYIAVPGHVVTTAVRGADAAAAADNARLLAAPNVVRVLEVRSATAGPVMRLLHRLARVVFGTCPSPTSPRAHRHPTSTDQHRPALTRTDQHVRRSTWRNPS